MRDKERDRQRERKTKEREGKIERLNTLLHPHSLSDSKAVFYRRTQETKKI